MSWENFKHERERVVFSDYFQGIVLTAHAVTLDLTNQQGRKYSLEASTACWVRNCDYQMSELEPENNINQSAPSQDIPFPKRFNFYAIV